ncbi:MAG: ATP-dependent helicase [Dictyoglomus sp.]|nr:ATP-dependent helicase [Dictyoglomus sp.]MCX7845688.1 ATP-dependent helicase [Dictyoglomaceae bacterium]MDW8188476.1 ATP-dependent helicase [Dictyoglomus sp.]
MREGIKNFLERLKRELNPEQEKVVLEGDGPCLVLAGPGSGKTRTIVYRVAYLLACGEDPSRIMLLTFTNHAAKEMLNRVVSLVQKNLSIVGGTFHHVGNKFLRKYIKELGIDENYNILDRDDGREIIKDCIEELEKDFNSEILQEIFSYRINTGKSWEEVLQEKAPHLMENLDIIKEIHKMYEANKRKLNVMDYDDLLWFWYKLLLEKEKIRELLDEHFLWVLVDEYQDTNWLQGEIIRLLRQSNKNILVVGDDAQSIYSFRGATLENMLNFPKIFENTKIFHLISNYRSTPEITNLANEIIKNNRNQYHKELKAIPKSGPKPKLVWAYDENEEARFIAEMIREIHKEGTPYKNIGVLFRSNYQSMSLQMELTRKGIPFEVRGGLRFFEQAHIKDMLSLLKILYNPMDQISAQRFFRLFPGIGRTHSKRLAEIIYESKSLERIFLLPMKGRTLDGVREIKRIWDGLRNVPFEKDISGTLSFFFREYYADYLKRYYLDYYERKKDIEQLIILAERYDNLENFLSELSLYTYTGERIIEEEEEKDILVLSTIHQAKGLEWEVVFVMRLVQGEFPNHRSMEKGLEEERRLFYVATTRAKRELFLTTVLTRFNKNLHSFSKPSIFIEEIDRKKLLEEWVVKDIYPTIHS